MTHASTGDPPTLAALVQFPVESLLLSSMSWYAQNFVCALQDWSLCFPHPVEVLYIQEEVAAWAQEGLEELSHIEGQEGRQ